jgi:hypothetical protein
MNDPNPGAESFGDPLDVARTLQRITLYAILPLWIVPAFCDYVFHRKSSIETTSGTHESLVHALQMSTMGLPTLMGLLLEIDASVIATMIAATAAHEGLVLWDIAYAEPLRRPSPNEQHMHSFLEVVPIMALVAVLSLHPAQTAALFGQGGEAPRWRLRFKQPQLKKRYLAAILGFVTALGVVPYAEELARCYRADRTVAPHRARDAARDAAAEPPAAPAPAVAQTSAQGA